MIFLTDEQRQVLQEDGAPMPLIDGDAGKCYMVMPVEFSSEGTVFRARMPGFGAVAEANGSEFHHQFLKATQELRLGHYWSRVRTPKDNSQLERFNRTIREAFLIDWPDCTDLDLLNGALFQWLDLYNHERPHAALQYRTPSEAAWGIS